MSLTRMVLAVRPSSRLAQRSSTTFLVPRDLHLQRRLKRARTRALLWPFSALPTRDKQFVFMSGVAHVTVLGTNRHKLWHAMRNFLTYPLQRAA
jgi:hypothetical protein